VLLTLALAAAETIGSESTAKLGLAARLVINTATLAIWSALYFGIQLVREGQLHELRAFEAESLASRNELKLLQAQISPHFLFNALNTILACKHDPDAIETVTHSLATYLRFLLRQSEALEPLGREIDALEEYLTIQSYRFGDRLSCRIDCESDIRRIPVLPMMIQPLVENALKYGSVDGRNLDVRIHAWREADRLFVEVANTGHWIPPDSTSSTGTGLQALRRRLLIHGGPAATLATAERDGWVRALLTIPLTEKYAAPSPAPRQPAAGNETVESA
jgi:LytS/YehU family sensor histidine kinase